MDNDPKVKAGEASGGEVTIELANGTIMRRVPTDDDGEPIGHYDAKVLHVDLGHPPPVTRIPEIRVLETLTDASTGNLARLIVAYPALRVFPTRAEVYVEGYGQFAIVTVTPQPALPHPDKRPGEALFEAIVEAT